MERVTGLRDGSDYVPPDGLGRSFALPVIGDSTAGVLLPVTA